MESISLPMRAGTLRAVAPRVPRGARPLVLLLHGGHGSWRHWRANLADLSAFVDPLAVDLPGYGDSDECPAGLSLSDYAQWVDEALRGLPPVAVVVGFSFGTLVATELARRWQHAGMAFLGTVLINPPLGAEVSPEVLAILDEGARQILGAAVRDLAVAVVKVHGCPFLNVAHVQSLLEGEVERVGRQPPAEWIHE